MQTLILSSSLWEQVSVIPSFVPKGFLDSTIVSRDVICLNVKDVKSKEVKQKMLRICRLCHVILLEPIRSVKNKQNTQSYKIFTGRTS